MRWRFNSSLAALIAGISLVLLLLIAFSAGRRNNGFLNNSPMEQQRYNNNDNDMRGAMPRGTNPDNNGGNLLNLPNRSPGLNDRDYTSPQPMTMADNRKAQNIKRQLSTLKETNKVNCLVAGNTALVGYSATNASKGEDATKDMIIKKVKAIDPSINNVIVSESADFMQKLGQLSGDVINRKPMEQIGKEFNDLMQKTAPEVR